MIIHFNGHGGVGKLTVAKILAAKLDAKLIDNHVVLDLVVSSVGRGGPKYLSMISKLMNVVFDEIAPLTKEKSFIFTNCLVSDYAEDQGRLDGIANFASQNQIPFVQILLECSLEENKKRITFENRKTKGKLMDPDILEKYYTSLVMYHPDKKHALRIDTTDKTPETVADEIYKYITSNVI
jgi:thymidylate kinase